MGWLQVDLLTSPHQDPHPFVKSYDMHGENLTFIFYLLETNINI